MNIGFLLRYCDFLKCCLNIFMVLWGVVYDEVLEEDRIVKVSFNRFGIGLS